MRIVGLNVGPNGPETALTDRYGQAALVVLALLR
jgi:hypothetical protein